MRELRGTLVLAAALAQVVATAVVVVSAWAYWRLYDKEAWPIVIPSLVVALAAESGIVFVVLRSQGGAISLLRVALAVVISWIGGAASFLAMDPVARPLHSQTPKIAWGIALVIVFLLARRLGRLSAAARTRAENC